ncbi:MAG: VPDSG-CTERM sorting domain-containing protein [Chthoniobacterales bacterium]
MAIVGAAVLFSVGSLSAQNLLTNPGFETPVLSPGGSAALAAGNTTLTGWTIGGHDVYLLQNTYHENPDNLTFNAHGGNNALDITGNGNTGADTISQTISTTVGARYLLSFWLGNAQGTTTAHLYDLPSSVSVSLTGQSSIAFTNAAITSGGINWVLETLAFTATSLSTTLTFTNITPAADNYAGLDDVILTAVPEAGTTASLLALSLTGLTFLRRKLS